MGSSYSSGKDWVKESDFGDVLDVLAGPSPWQPYILPNLKVAKSSPKSFKVLKVDQFKEKTRYGKDVPGVTYKQTGDIIMQQWGAKETTFLSAALHECVHLVSDPAKQGSRYSTAYAKLGDGLLEGLVESVTEDILTAQGIALAPTNMRGHQERVPIVRELMKGIGVSLFARVLFQGDDAQFSMVMEFVYSKSGWIGIKAMTTAKLTRQALDLMRDSRAKEAENRKRADTVKQLTGNNQTLLDIVLKMGL